MKKKNFLSGLLAIANTLSGNAREFADEVVKAFEALEADTAEHDVTTLKDEIGKIAARFAEQDQAVAEKIAQVRESIMSELRKNTATIEDKFTPQVKLSIVNAMLTAQNKKDAIERINEIAKENDIEIVEDFIFYNNVSDYTIYEYIAEVD